MELFKILTQLEMRFKLSLNRLKMIFKIIKSILKNQSMKIKVICKK